MQEAHGHVTMNEQVPSERFSRFVEEKVQDWMKDHGFDMAKGAATYEVAFFDEEALGQVSCLVIIQRGNELWRAWEEGDNPRTALSRSLEHLKIEEDESIVNETTNRTQH